MSEHVFDDLPQLLSGEADRATVVSVAAHLRSCADCRDELISAVVAHSALTSAVRFAPDLTVSGEPVQQPATDPRPLPDLSAVFAQVRAEVDAERSGGQAAEQVAPRQRVGRTWLAAAAVVVAAGVSVGGYYVADHGSSSPSGRTVALAAYGVGTSGATARLLGANQMQLDASSLPQLSGSSYYEVWLTNTQRTAMAPVGPLDADRQGEFTVPNSVMGAYAAIEVSVQSTQGVGSYSGTSVLRGAYS